MRRDPAAPTAFNGTLEGVWRSFFAAVLLLPLHFAYLALIGPAPGSEQAPAGLRWMIQFFVYVIGWAAWPLIAYYMTRLMDCSERLYGYLAAYNWSQLLTAPFLIGLDVLGRIALPHEVGLILELAALAGVLVYAYLIARQMLGVAANKAIVLVMTAFLLALVLRDTTDFALKLATPELP